LIHIANLSAAKITLYCRHAKKDRQGALSRAIPGMTIRQKSRRGLNFSPFLPIFVPLMNWMPAKLKRLLLILMAYVIFQPGLWAQCSSTISSFPYYEGFENNNGGWSPGGTNSDWSWGSPIKPVINAANAGAKCWVTGTLAQSSYAGNQNSTLTSPCFNFTGLASPYIRFYIFWETERKYDGASFQYSIDGGNSWTTLGSYSDFLNCQADNWFNTSGVTALGSDGWSGNVQPTSPCTGGAGNGSGGWRQAKHSMNALAGQANVRFRFRFAAGNVCNQYDGFAVDDIWIGESPLVQPSISYDCTGPNTIAFSSAASCGTSLSWDFGDPASGASNISSLPSPSHSYSDAGQYTVTLTVSSGSQSVSTQQSVTVLSVNTLIKKAIVCEGERAELEAVVSPAGSYNYSWNTSPLQTTAIATGVAPGNYTITVTGSDVCSATDNIMVTGATGLQLNLGRDTVLCNGGQLLLQPGSFDSYLWNDGSNAAQLQVNRTGTFWVKVSDNNGCTASDTIQVVMDCSELNFPDAFSPNGDRLNDHFGAIGNLAGVEAFELAIFNRWGQRIFYSRDPYKKWDGFDGGRFSGPQVFAWTARYRIAATGLSVNRKGTVMVIH